MEYQHRAIIDSPKDAGLLISALEGHRSSISAYEPGTYAERKALDEERAHIHNLIQQLLPVYRGRRHGE